MAVNWPNQLICYYIPISQDNDNLDKMDSAPLTASFWTQLRATVIRNLIRKKRNKKHTSQELFVPVIYLMVIVILSLTIKPQKQEAILHPTGQSSVYSKVPFTVQNRTDISVAPNSEDIKGFIDEIVQPLARQHDIHLTFHYFESEVAMEEKYRNDSSSVFLGLILDNIGSNLDYKIRVNPDVVSLPTNNWGDQGQCRGNASNLEFWQSCPTNAYFWSGFAVVQALVENAWIKKLKPTHILPSVSLQLLPKPSYTSDTETVLRSIVPLYLIICFSPFLSAMCQFVVEEKEKKIKEGMKMVGLRDSVFWLSWFIVYSLLIIIFSIVCSVLVNFVVFSQTMSYYPVVLILMLEMGFSMVVLAFMSTVFFDKAKNAGIAGSLGMMVFACLYYLQVFLEDSSTEVFWFLGLLSPTAFAMSMDKILHFDIHNRPLSQSILWDTSTTGIPIAGAMIMLAVDIMLYGLLAAWLDNIMPTEYGTRLKPWFFLTPEYWTGVNKAKVGTSPYSITVNDDPDIEHVPEELTEKEAVIINEIHKTFTGVGKKKVHAVQGVSLNVYPGEITALLGHNGAGKSTLFNILTGMTAPSKGSAHIFGYNVSNPNEMEQIRKMIGICPQHDVLFDELTAREHLIFFARIRGISEDLIPQEVDSIIDDIDLREKADALASKLSGGQKRKLSVGIALIGDPKIIFLDEPTAGVDPYSRRHLWSVLKKRKEGKVILLTTHFMDEADILADRKAIMSKGKIRCYGSSLFLKNRFGLGYHLTIVLAPENDPEGIGHLINNHVPGAEKARQFGRELSYILPRQNMQQFPKLFEEIEREIQNKTLGISSYGVSMTTLEEVFLQLGEQEETDEVENDKDSSSQPDVVRHSIVKRQFSIGNSPSQLAAQSHNNHSSEGYNFESVATSKSNWQIYKALIYLRVRRIAREPGAIIWQVIMPIIFVSLGMYLNSQGGLPTSEDMGLHISQDIYGGAFQPATFGFQNDTGGRLDIVDGLEKVTKGSLDDVTGVTFANLINLNHLAVFSFQDPQLFDKRVKEQNNSSDLIVGTYHETASSGGLMGWYNDTARHSIPIMINTLSRASALQQNIQGKINLTSHAFPLTTMAAGFQGFSFGAGMMIGMAYVLVPMGFAFVLIEDREIRAKNQLRVNGLSFLLYFGTFFTILGLLMLLVLVLLLVMVVVFDLPELLIPEAFGLLSSMYFLIIIPCLLFVGCFSYLFDKMQTAQNFISLAIYMGMIPYIAVMMTDMMLPGKPAIAETLHIVSAFLVPVYIPFGIVYYVGKVYLVCTFVGNCDSLAMSDYMVPEIYCLYLAIACHFVFWGLVIKIADIVKDGGNWRDAIPFIKSENVNYQNDDVIENEDDDVTAERTTVAEYMSNRSTPSPLPVIAVHNLRKVYKTGVDVKKSKKKNKKTSTKVAVRNMSLSVAPGEVFGLLGHNGAGKTTTMRIIIAEEAASNGRVRIGERDIMSNQSEAFNQLGYCPQFDAVWKNNTVREHLEAYASIRGVPPTEIGPLAERYMAGLRIMEHADKLSQDCSGGTKRKLSYAMAMLGNPNIVLLDEPSTGMDPQSKRFVWDTILASFKQSRGAILTTHSMEEADALCTRVGIMVKGALRCLGATQHLKNKYGAGYLLDLKIRGGSADWDSLESHVKAMFPGAVLVEAFADRRTYSIAQNQVRSLADAFRQLEICREKYSVEDYSFSQTTLEQVFIEFAKQQENEKEHQRNGSTQLTSL